jgi:outer membrane lipoprotein
MKSSLVIAMALCLSACVSAPKALQGQFSTLTPEQSAQREASGELVRWGGRIVSVEPGRQNSCFEIVAAPLTDGSRPRVLDKSLGRFIACRAGFYDPEVFKAGRDITITGRIEGFESRKVGDYDYRYPKIAADVVYLWPERRDVDVIVERPVFGGWFGRRW